MQTLLTNAMSMANCDAPLGAELKFYSRPDGYGLQLSYENLENVLETGAPFSVCAIGHQITEDSGGGFGRYCHEYLVWAFDGEKALPLKTKTTMWIYYGPKGFDVCPYCGTDNTGLRQGWDCIACGSN